jgi:hypothetical protein
MVRLAHDSGGPATLKCGQVLGNESPLEFDEDGYAHVDDPEAAEQIAALHRHVDVEPAAQSPASSDDPAETDAVESPIHPTEHTVDDLEAALEDGDFTGDELDAIAAAEADGDDRETALEAIDDARPE